MDLGLRNKVVLVSASSHGLGKAAAFEFAREGARVAICARNETDLHAAAEDIRAATGADILPLQVDVTQQEQITTAVESIVAQWGGLDVLVANAGGARAGTFDVLSDEDWERGWRLNFLSTVQQIRAVLPHMQRAAWGRIIAITSVSVKQPLDDLLISSSVRPGVVGLVRSLANQLGQYGITVNNVAPGYTRTARLEELFTQRAEQQGRSFEATTSAITEQTAVGRMAEPEEVAAAIVFLASTRAAYITGQTLLVDGGSYRGLM